MANVETVPKRQVLASRDVVVAAAGVAGGTLRSIRTADHAKMRTFRHHKVIRAEAVRGQESVGAGMPMRRETQVTRMIKHCDPRRLTTRIRTEVIDPFRSLAPRLAILVAAAVENRAIERFVSPMFRHFHRAGHAHQQTAVLHVAERDGFVTGVDFYVVVHQQLLFLQRDECEPDSLTQHKLSIAEPPVPKDQFAGLAGRHAFEFHFRGMPIPFFARRPPEIEPVDIAVHEPQRTMPRMVLTFTRHAFLHRVMAGHAFAVGADDGIEKRRNPFLVTPLGEKFPADLHADAVFKFREFDVRRRTSGRKQNGGEASDETFHICVERLFNSGK